MSEITNHMRADHRHCDEALANLENLVSEGKWGEVKGASDLFVSLMARHFRMEEEVLFPAFEQSTGMTQGPTEMMRMEHARMREQLALIEKAVVAEDKDNLLGVTEALMFFIQQHNMKEEQVLYPMADQHLSDQAANLVEKLAAV